MKVTFEVKATIEVEIPDNDAVGMIVHEDDEATEWSMGALEKAIYDKNAEIEIQSVGTATADYDGMTIMNYICYDF